MWTLPDVECRGFSCREAARRPREAAGEIALPRGPMASQLTQAAARHLGQCWTDHTSGQPGVPAASAAANSYSSKQVVIIRICICDDELVDLAC
jgi:hypothetical protein